MKQHVLFQRGSSLPVRRLALCAMLAAGVPAAAFGDDSPVQSAVLAGSVFGLARGTMQVNVATGSANRQVNAIAIRIGIAADGALDEALARTAASVRTAGPVRGSAAAQQRVVAAPGAFAGAVGIVQVDQIAGNGNAAANTLSVHVAAPHP